MARRKPVTQSGPEGAVDVDSRKLLTLRDGDVGKGLEGALVRYQASADLPSAEVERRAAQILAWGAAAVKVEKLSAESAATASIPAPAVGETVAETPTDGRSIFHGMGHREAVLTLARQVKTVPVDELVAVLEEALTEAKL